MPTPARRGPSWENDRCRPSGGVFAIMASEAPITGPGRLAAAPNFRDIGGLPAASGRRVAYGRVFRSEAVLSPGPDDLAVLEAHGVRLVCDLRTAPERAGAPNAFWRARGVELLELDIVADIRGRAHLDAMQADPGEGGAIELMRLTYRALPAAAAEHLRQLFRRIDEGHLPLLVHCTAGKDRTGVVIAMLLAALGAPREAIYADYLESGKRPNPAVSQATRELMSRLLGGPVEEAALQALAGVRPEYLDESFAAVEAAYGSVDGYLLQAAGLDEALRGRVRERLLEA